MSSVHLHLIFPAHLIDEPVLYRLVRDFDVVPNIKRANVDASFAWAIVELSGDDDAIDRATEWLRQQDIEITEIDAPEGGAQP